MTILLTEAQIRARVAELASAIRRDAGHDTTLHFVGVLTGAFVFMADLMRAAGSPATCDFVRMSSYGSGTESRGVTLPAGPLHPMQGRDVVIVEEIIDSGRSLATLQALVREFRPASVRTVALLDKPSRRVVPAVVDYVGFTIEDRFVVGYGLDFDERYRELPHVAVLEERDR